MDYRNWVIEWFENHSTASREQIMENLDKNYFDLSYIDSFQFIELISDIEEIGIELGNDQFEDRNFATINGLIGILEQMK